MKINDLVSTGLNETQARSYAYLLQHGCATPPQLSKAHGLTRSNAYKVLDQLTELGLAKKEEINRKFTYYPDNPLALNTLVSQQHNLAKSREEAVNFVMKDLLNSYHTHNEQPNIIVKTGKEAVVSAYMQQIKLMEPIYFLRSSADITAMSFDTMHNIRIAPHHYGTKRHGLTPDKVSSEVNSATDHRSALARTWYKQEDYDAPVEWSVSGSTLLIVLFGAEPHSITIESPTIAMAFRQIWALLNSLLLSSSDYSDLPRAK
jgi:predicted transcriptional regulator